LNSKKHAAPGWIEVSLTVDGELAEAVADVLARFAPDGVVIESTKISADPVGEGRPMGPLRVFCYLPADTMIEETRRRLEEALWYLGRIRPLPMPEYRPIQQVDWTDAWRQHYRPIEIGRKLVIVPAWIENPCPERIAIRIDPGMAFGTGTHPTTQLCLELVEEIIEGADQRSDMQVIDLGCGSGILSVAALKLGVAHALGVDIDEVALRSARKNAQTNGVAEQLEFGLGSLTEILDGTYSIRQAHLVLANILAPVVVRLLDEGLGKLLMADGEIVLSGILDEQVREVAEAVKRNGLRMIDRRQIEDWVALCVAR
jgi:ribosomal protein L11 methyltransferase